MTLRTRFALWLGALMLATLATFGTVVYLAVSTWLSASVDDSLRLSATQLIATSDVDHGKIDVPDDSVILDAQLTEELRAQGFTIQVFSPAGTVVESLGLFANLALEPADLQAAKDGRTNLTSRPDPAGADSVRVYVQGVPGDAGLVAIVQVSQSLHATEALRQTLLSALLLGSPILVLAAGVGGYLLAGRALAPIDDITKAARRISTESLSGRLDLPPSEDEVGRLAATFDDMLARLEDGFERERRFTHDAAHELRTPLAAMQSILTVIAERRRTVEDYEVALADIGQEAARLRLLTEDLLRLARTEHSPELTEDVDLSLLVPDVVETMSLAAGAKGLELRCEVDGDLRVLGDTDALIRLLLNLIDNAIKFTTSGAITVRGTGTEESVILSVRDTGEGIAARDLPHVFERFYRAEEARTTPGTGLGLAICSVIAHTHGGSIVVDSELGRGSTFTVTLPRDRERATRASGGRHSLDKGTGVGGVDPTQSRLTRANP